jgi:uncharacterized protein
MVKIEDRQGHAVFSVRVSPGAARTKIIGEHDGALKVSVNAPPEKGKANKELVDYLAEILGVKRAAVTVISGETSRQKKIAVEGFTAAALRAKIAESVS